MMVVMMVMIEATGYHDDARTIIVIAVVSAELVVVMMVVMVVIEKLRLLNVFIGRGDRTGLVDHLQQGRRVRDRFKQVRERVRI